MGNNLTISQEEVKIVEKGLIGDFPKYTTTILNKAMNTAQANRPHTVGPMSEIYKKWRDENPEGTFEEWKQYYYEKHEGEEKLDESFEKTKQMLENFRDAMPEITDEMIRQYVKDLVVFKSYKGFGIEELILQKVSEQLDCDYRNAGQKAESEIKDGYIGDQPVSVKPLTYKTKPELQEEIEFPIIYYEEDEDTNELTVDYAEVVSALQ